MTEQTIQKHIMLALSNAGCLIFRNNTGMYRTPDGRVIRYGLAVGSSDLIGIAPDGRFLALEVKTKRGRPTKEQLLFINAVLKAGGIAGIVRSPEEALQLINHV